MCIRDRFRYESTFSTIASFTVSVSDASFFSYCASRIFVCSFILVLTAVSNIVEAFSLNSSDKSASDETSALTSSDKSISTSSVDSSVASSITSSSSSPESTSSAAFFCAGSDVIFLSFFVESGLLSVGLTTGAPRSSASFSR